MAVIKCTEMVSVAADGTSSTKEPTPQEIQRSLDVISKSVENTSLMKGFSLPGKVSEYLDVLLSMMFSRDPVMIYESPTFAAAALVTLETGRWAEGEENKEGECPEMAESEEYKRLKSLANPEYVPFHEDFRTIVAPPRLAYVKAHGPVLFITFMGAADPGEAGVKARVSMLKGLCDRARAEGRDVWAEAIDDDEVTVFDRAGFAKLEPLTIAKGRHTFVPMVWKHKAGD